MGRRTAPFRAIAVPIDAVVLRSLGVVWLGAIAGWWAVALIVSLFYIGGAVPAGLTRIAVGAVDIAFWGAMLVVGATVARTVDGAGGGYQHVWPPSLLVLIPGLLGGFLGLGIASTVGWSLPASAVLAVVLGWLVVRTRVYVLSDPTQTVGGAAGQAVSTVLTTAGVAWLIAIFSVVSHALVPIPSSMLGTTLPGIGVGLDTPVIFAVPLGLAALQAGPQAIGNGWRLLAANRDRLRAAAHRLRSELAYVFLLSPRE